MSTPNPKVDGFLRSPEWRAELTALRKILLDCDLTEEIKWRQPCYTADGKIVALIGRFKESCALLFFKGALLKDPQNLLEKPGENSQAGRRIRFTQVQEITALAPVLKAYLLEAIAVEKAGLKVKLKKITERKIPVEFQTVLDAQPAVKKAFEGLTPGRQRAYLLHFSSAKQSPTRAARVEKCLPRIRQGKGLLDD